MRQSLFFTLGAIVGALAAPVAQSNKVQPGDITSKRMTSSIRRSNQVIARQSKPCFVVGNEELPEETQGIADNLAASVQCDAANPTIDGVPDVSSGGMTFSSIDFNKAENGETPLQFAVNLFQTADQDGGKLADSNLEQFQNALNDYLATEAGIRSVGGNLAIKAPKFFLQMQVSRIQTAQGNPPTEAGLQVDHLRDKVLKNAPREDQALLDQVTQLATVVA